MTVNEDQNVNERPWSPPDAAQYLGKSIQTLAQWRYLGIGPSYVKIGRRTIIYRKVDIDRWLAENLRTPDQGTH